jgi:predicted enzyme related to lactoylglutathione lyase
MRTGAQSEARLCQVFWDWCACASRILFRDPQRLSLAFARIRTPRRVDMSNAGNHHRINYIEFTSTDIDQTKHFYAAVFGWSFQDWGPDYVSFHGAGIDGGFARRTSNEGPAKFAPLVILYSSDLTSTEIAIRAEGGGVVVPVFEFPGGQRFHFSDGAGNVLGVWSE